MQKFDWKNLYFVFATLIGLIMIVIGISTGVNALLSSTVFKVTPQKMMPPQPPVIAEQVPAAKGQVQSADDKKALEQWKADYGTWQEEQKSYDYEAENRKRSLAFAIAALSAGIPVFLLHAPFVFKRS